jgi:hypothetical protein
MELSWALGLVDLVEMALAHCAPAPMWEADHLFFYPIGSLVVLSMHETLAEKDGKLDHLDCSGKSTN